MAAPKALRAIPQAGNDPHAKCSAGRPEPREYAPSLGNRQYQWVSRPLAVRRLVLRFGVPIETARTIAEHAGFLVEAPQ